MVSVECGGENSLHLQNSQSLRVKVSATTRAAAGMALEEPPELSAQASGPQAGQTPSDRTASTVRVLRGCHRRWRCAYLARKQMI